MPGERLRLCITAASVAAEETRRAQLSETAAVEDERTHRALHAGQMPGRVKLTWC